MLHKLLTDFNSLLWSQWIIHVVVQKKPVVDNLQLLHNNVELQSDLRALDCTCTGKKFQNPLKQSLRLPSQLQYPCALLDSWDNPIHKGIHPGHENPPNLPTLNKYCPFYLPSTKAVAIIKIVMFGSLLAIMVACLPSW